jgi:hypothetical protein
MKHFIQSYLGDTMRMSLSIAGWCAVAAFCLVYNNHPIQFMVPFSVGYFLMDPISYFLVSYKKPEQ